MRLASRPRRPGGQLAQLVEHGIENAGVPGSSPGLPIFEDGAAPQRLAMGSRDGTAFGRDSEGAAAADRRFPEIAAVPDNPFRAPVSSGRSRAANPIP